MQRFDHVLQLGNLQGLPQSVVSTGPLGIQVKSDEVDNMHVSNNNLLADRRPRISVHPVLLHMVPPFITPNTTCHTGRSTKPYEHKSTVE